MYQNHIQHHVSYTLILWPLSLLRAHQMWLHPRKESMAAPSLDSTFLLSPFLSCPSLRRHTGLSCGSPPPLLSYDTLP